MNKRKIIIGVVAVLSVLVVLGVVLLVLYKSGKFDETAED